MNEFNHHRSEWFSKNALISSLTWKKKERDRKTLKTWHGAGDQKMSQKLRRKWTRCNIFDSCVLNGIQKSCQSAVWRQWRQEDKGEIEQEKIKWRCLILKLLDGFEINRPIDMKKRGSREMMGGRRRKRNKKWEI